MGKIFNITYIVADKLLSISNDKKSEKTRSLCYLVLFFISGYIACVTQRVPYYLLIICFIILIINDAHKYLLSIRHFLTVGLCYWIIFSLMLMVIFLFFGASVFFAYVIFAITWCFYSLLANNKVACAANQIISALLAVIVLLKDTIMSLMPDAMLNTMFDSDYSIGQLAEATFNLICTPILIVNLISMTLCMLKGYWIERYNDYKDTGQKGMDVEKEIETLKENEKHLYEQINQLTEQVAKQDKN